MSRSTTQISISPRLTLSDAQQAIIDFIGLLIINLSVVVVPAKAPAWIGAIFLLLGFLAILVRSELPPTNPSKYTTSQVTLFMAVASILSAINGYVAITFATYWWAGLILGVIGAIILAIRQITEGAPIPPPLPSPSRSLSGASPSTGI